MLGVSLGGSVEVVFIVLTRLLYRKKLDSFLHYLLGERWIPLYSMVSFTTIPYAEVIYQDILAWYSFYFIHYPNQGNCACRISGSCGLEGKVCNPSCLHRCCISRIHLFPRWCCEEYYQQVVCEVVKSRHIHTGFSGERGKKNSTCEVQFFRETPSLLPRR